jgi:hypothetical protein
MLACNAAAHVMQSNPTQNCAVLMASFILCPYFSSVYTGGGPDAPRTGGLPISMLGSHLSSGRCEQHTTRTTIVLAFWQIDNNLILMMFGTS